MRVIQKILVLSVDFDDLLYAKMRITYLSGLFSSFCFFPVWSKERERESKQGSKQASKQGNKQAGKQGNKQASKQAREGAREQASKQARTQAREQARKQGSKQASSKPASKQASKQVSKPAKEQGSKQASKQSSKEENKSGRYYLGILPDPLGGIPFLFLFRCNGCLVRCCPGALVPWSFGSLVVVVVI